MTSLFHLPPSSFSHFCKLNICSEVIWVIFNFDNFHDGLSKAHTHTHTHSLYRLHTCPDTQIMQKEVTSFCWSTSPQTRPALIETWTKMAPCSPLPQLSRSEGCYWNTHPSVDLPSSWSPTSLLLNKQPLNLSVLQVLAPRSLIPVTNQLTWKLTGTETWI